MKHISELANTHIWRYFKILIGSLIAGLGYSTFIIPAKLLASGLSGIAVIVYYLIDLPIGLQLIVYNIPIVYLAYRVFGKLYAIDTIIGTVMLSIAIDATSFIGTYHIVEDPILNSVFGGVLVGIGCGIVFRANSNGGGFDVLGAVIKKYYSLDLGTVVFGFNLIIILVGIVLFNVSIGLYTLINMYIVGEITNKVVAGFNRKKLIIIVSPFAELMAGSIMQYLGRGVTFMHGEGAYSRKDRKVIFVVVSLTQVSKIKLIASAIDPTAFMIITDTSEVTGHGFTIKNPKEITIKKT
ncbi:YitT family protein [uncultured Megamonas sp.]|uniref:YitT family protein n=1 Tax=uncultured Megamonas sp. TaxID=286140 RepID=UPI0025E5FD6C|nr:YitT family protein [uncultured Megamonas sp.]